MKQLLIAFFTLYCIACALPGFSQTCTPNPNACTPRPACIDPPEAPKGKVGQPYSEVVQMNFVQKIDTLSLTFTISEVKIDAIRNLPPGLSMKLTSGNPRDNTLPANGGVPTNGTGKLTPKDANSAIFACAVFYGTPTQATAPGDSGVKIEVTVTLKGIISQTVKQSFRYKITIEDPAASLAVTAMGTPSTMVCGEIASLVATANKADATYSWMPVTGLSAPTAATTSAQPLVTTTYTVTAKSGTETAKSEVLVTVTPIPAPTISATANTLKASTTGVTYKWSKDGTPIGGATAQEYTVTEKGDYVVEITDSKGCTNKSEPKFMDPTGISHPFFESRAITVYPNPTTRELTVVAPLQGAYTITMYNAMGQVVQTVSSHAQSFLQESLDVSHLPAGLYTLKIASERQKFTKTIIKQ